MPAAGDGAPNASDHHYQVQESATTQPEPTSFFSPSRYSSSNPYYGYSSVGPRRKRDLIRTLAFLFIIKWKKRIQLVFAMLSAIAQSAQSRTLQSLGVISSGLRHISLIPHLFFGGLNYRSRSRLAHPSIAPLLVTVLVATATIMARNQRRQGGSIFDVATLRNLLVALTASGVSGGMALSATGS